MNMCQKMYRHTVESAIKIGLIQIILAIVASTGFADVCNWEQLNGYPTNHNLVAVHASGNNFLAVSDIGVVYKSTDAGKTWEKQPGGVSNGELNRAWFIDDTTIVAPGYQGIYVKKGSQGAWVNQFVTYTIGFNEVFLINEKKGFVTNAIGNLYTTTTGIDSWRKNELASDMAFKQIAFIDSFGCFLTSRKSIFFTFDSGTTWKRYDSAYTERIECIVPIDSAGHKFLYGVSSSGRPVRIKSGDTTVTASTQSSRSYIERVVQHGDTLWGINYDSLKYSIDFGMTWRPVAKAKSKLLDIDFTGNAGCAVGEYGEVLMISRDKMSVTDIDSLIKDDFTDAFLLSPQTGFITCDNGKILKSVDGGKTLTKVFSDSKYSLKALSFVDTKTGYAVGYSNYFGVILRTSDGGESWKISKDSCPSLLNDIMFTSKKGWIAGYRGLLMASDNGGANWSYVDSGSVKVNFYSLGAFPNGDIIIGAMDSALYKCSKGKISRKKADTRQEWAVLDVQCINDTLAYATGTRYNLITNSGEMLRTRDAGETWSEIGSSPCTFPNALFFINGKTGWIADNKIAYSDSVHGWDSQVKCGNEIISFSNAVNGCVWAVGKRGQLYVLHDDRISSCKRETAKRSPAGVNIRVIKNGSLNINIALSIKEKINIQLFDAQGKAVTQNFGTFLSSGSHNLSFSLPHLSSGSYFCYVKSDNYSAVKKFMVIY